MLSLRGKLLRVHWYNIMKTLIATAFQTAKPALPSRVLVIEQGSKYVLVTSGLDQVFGCL